MSELRSLTELIHRMQTSRDRRSTEAVFAAAAARLRELAGKMMAREPRTGSFGASDLLQEAFLQKVARLSAGNLVSDREHFFSLMARGMRQVLIDRGRRRRAAKRMAPESATGVVPGPDPELATLRRLMARLQALDPVGFRILRLKSELGLTWEEISAETGLPVSQCRAEYGHAMYWLRRRMGHGTAPAAKS